MDMYNNNVGMTESVLTLRHQFPDRFTKYSTNKCLCSPLSLTYCSKLHTRSERWYSINYLLWSFLNGKSWSSPMSMFWKTKWNIYSTKTTSYYLQLCKCVTQCNVSLASIWFPHYALYIVLWHFKFPQKYSWRISNIRHQMNFKNKYMHLTCISGKL